MLFLLITAQRCQTFHIIYLEDVFNQGKFIIKTQHMLTQTWPGFHLQDIILEPFHNPNLCIVKTMQEYLSRTEGLQGFDDN